MNKILEIAMAEVGTKEFPPNSNKVKYNTWIWNKEVSGPEYPWCAAFFSWCYYQAGFPIQKAGLAKGFVGCPYALKNLSKWGRLVTVPQPCDAAFFDWDGDGKFD